MRLHLLCTLHGLPVSFGITGAKAGERQAPLGVPDDPQLMAGRTRQVIFADKNYYGHDFETALADGRICLLRSPGAAEPGHPGNQFFKPLRQTIESVNDTLKGQLDLERHGGHTRPA